MIDIRLKELRAKRGLTQRQIFEAIKLGERNYQDFEYGNTKPSYETLIALGDYFDVSLDYLTGRTDYPEINKGADFCDNEQNLGNNTNTLGNNEHEQLMNIAEEVRGRKRVDKTTMEQTILELCAVKPLTINEISDFLGRTKENTRKYVSDLTEKDELELLYPESETHPKQAYRTK